MRSPPRVLLACLTLALLNCSGEPKKPEAEVGDPPVTEEFKAQVKQFIDEGSNTTAKVELCVPCEDLREQVVSTHAAHDRMLAVWPGDFAAEARADFDKAIEGWELGLSLLELKIAKKDKPTAPDINSYPHYLAYGLGYMEVDRYAEDYLVEAYRGKNYLDFDANITTLLKLAGESFESGRKKIQSALDEEGGAE